MNMLDEIIAYKKQDVELKKLRKPIGELEQSPLFRRSTLSMTAAIQRPGTNGIIAEIKRKSPSKGTLHENASVQRIAPGYVSAGAAALSVLTDGPYFGGSNDDLTMARTLVDVPILRKDFIVDEYQVVETKALGADVMLLIAGALPPMRLKTLSSLARSFGLQVLLEVHDACEIETTCDVPCDLIGVNNRDLASFAISVDVSRELAGSLPRHIPAVSESGIEDPALIAELKQLGYSGFLIGGYFMRQEIPEAACRQFIKLLKK